MLQSPYFDPETNDILYNFLIKSENTKYLHITASKK